MKPLSVAELPPILRPPILNPEDAYERSTPRPIIGCRIEELREQYRPQQRRKRAPLTVASLTFGQRDFDQHLSLALAHQDVECEVMVEDNRDNHTALSKFYNKVIDSAQHDLILFCHPDVEFSPWGLSALLRTFHDVSDCGALGLVGISLQGLVTWSDRRRCPREVSTLDSCMVMIDRRQGLRFDEDVFNTFHCVVEDYCLQAQSCGRKSYVAPGVSLAHFGSTTFQSPARTEGWVKECKHFLSRLESKWPGIPFCTTIGYDTHSEQVRNAYQNVCDRLQALQHSPVYWLHQLFTMPATALRYLARKAGVRRMLARIQRSAAGPSRCVDITPAQK
jgi:hypothetical protein